MASVRLHATAITHRGAVRAGNEDTIAVGDWIENGCRTSQFRKVPDGRVILITAVEVPFAALIEDGSFSVETVTRDGITRPVYYFDYQGDTIWGATARILVHYLELLSVPGLPWSRG